MVKGQKSTIYYFLVAAAIVVAAAAFLRVTYEAKAAESVSIENATSTGYTGYASPAANVFGQSFTAVDPSVSAVAIWTTNGDWRTSSTSKIAIALCRGIPTAFDATSTYLGSFDINTGYAADCGDMETIWSEVDVEDARKTDDAGWFKISIPPQLTTIDEWYTFLIVAYNPTLSTYYYFTDPSAYADGQAMMHGTSSKDLMFRIYDDIDSVATSSTYTWTGWPVDNSPPTYTAYGSQRACDGSASRIYYSCYGDCNGDSIQAYWFDIGGSNRIMADVEIGSTTVDAASSTDNYVAIWPHNGTGYMRYCIVITDPHKRWPINTMCGIRINWLSQQECSRREATAVCIANSASSTVCTGDDAGADWFGFACGMKKFSNWAFTPSAQTCIDYHDAMYEIQTQFPLNVYQEVKDTMTYISNENSTSTALLGLPLYWNGTSTGYELLNRQAIDASDAGPLFNLAYTWIEYLMYALATWYFIVRVLNFRNMKDE